ncbi:MAG: DegV family protein [Chloroflexi bacterium]|nr:MAG: DegV family protein [Chloroflexota bacterium]
MSSQRVAIVTDSTADLPVDLARERGITVVPLTVRLDGRSYLDGEEIGADEFYLKLAGASGFPSTSQPSPGRFAEAYKALLQDYDEVVSLHISAKLSGTYAAAVQGAQLVDRERIRVVDSEAVSMWLALLALAAGDVAKRGGDAVEVVETVQRVSRQTVCYFTVSTLEFLHRGGRIGRASALLGSVLQIKPVLCIRDGEVTPLERVRTLERATARIIELARDNDRGKGLCVSVGHAAAEAAAFGIARRLEDVAESLVVQPLGPVVGAHAGPGTVGIACYPAELFPLGLKLAGGVGAAR